MPSSVSQRFPSSPLHTLRLPFSITLLSLFVHLAANRRALATPQCDLNRLKLLFFSFFYLFFSPPPSSPTYASSTSSSSSSSTSSPSFLAFLKLKRGWPIVMLSQLAYSFILSTPYSSHPYTLFSSTLYFFFPLLICNIQPSKWD